MSSGDAVSMAGMYFDGYTFAYRGYAFEIRVGIAWHEVPFFAQPIPTAEAFAFALGDGPAHPLIVYAGRWMICVESESTQRAMPTPSPAIEQLAEAIAVCQDLEALAEL